MTINELLNQLIEIAKTVPADTPVRILDFYASTESCIDSVQKEFGRITIFGER